jgi:hypothetical protein
MTHVVGIAVGDATDQRVDIFYLNAAGLDAASTDVLAASGVAASYSIIATGYAGAKQSVPTLVDSEAATGDSDPLTNIDLAYAASDAVYGCGGSGNTSTGVTWGGTDPLIDLINGNVNATAHHAAAELVAGAGGTANHECTFTTAPNRVAGAACVIELVVSSQIAKVNGIDWGNIAKINGVAIANIAKVNGVAV